MPVRNITGDWDAGNLILRNANTRSPLLKIESDGTIGKQSIIILKFLQSTYPKGFTRNEISRRLGIKINAVCGRVKELLLARWLKEEGKRKDKFTGKSNYILKFVGDK